MDPGTLLPITYRTLSERVYENLRERILRGDMRPGEFIREHDVSRAMDVSRTPVRDALGRLASEGFLERLPHRGFRVPAEPIGDLLQLYPIMTALEVLAGRDSFPRLERSDLARLREVNDECRSAVERRDARSGIEWNHEFHRLLSSRCGNRRLCVLLDDLRSQVARLEYWSVDHPEHAAEAIEQHEAILRAIEAGRVADALEILDDNRLQTYRSFLLEMRQTGVAPRAQAASMLESAVQD